MIKAEHLSFEYPCGRKVLEDVSLAAKPGQCVAILGNNGVGKSTLLRCLNRLIEPQSGAVYLQGRDMSMLSRRDVARQQAYVAQSEAAVSLTVYDAVLLGRKPFIRFDPTGEDHEIVRAALTRMRLTDDALRYVDELSGGEMQKVAIARALCQQPQVLLLDEPTSSLDLKNQHALMALLRGLAHEENILCILVLHDLNLALRYCDGFILLKDANIFAAGGRDIMTADTLSEVYGLPLCVETIHGSPVILPR